MIAKEIYIFNFKRFLSPFEDENLGISGLSTELTVSAIEASKCLSSWDADDKGALSSKFNVVDCIYGVGNHEPSWFVHEIYNEVLRLGLFLAKEEKIQD